MYKLGDKVLYVPKDSDENIQLVGEVVGVLKDLRYPLYFLSSDKHPYSADALTPLPQHYEFWIELDTENAEFTVDRIDSVNQAIRSRAEYLNSFKIVDVKPEIVVSVYWSTIPGSIPKRSVKEYLRDVVLSGSRISERTN
jgi:hypothetical protein